MENPLYEPIERAGRRGLRFPDGAILWDDGEKEVPTSGLSDLQKRNEARNAAIGEPLVPTRVAVSDAEVAELDRLARVLSDPGKLLAERKEAAKERARRKPAGKEEADPAALADEARVGGEASERPLPASLNEIGSAFRLKAKLLLEREITRLEELVGQAIAGQIELSLNGLRVTDRNPPMRLHEVILATVRIADAASVPAIMTQLREIRSWGTWTGVQDSGLPAPPPDGYPASVPVELPPATSNPGIQRGSSVVHDGGQPTEYPGAAQRSR